MPEQNDKVFGPKETQEVSPAVLVDRLKQSLIGKGVKFTEAAGVNDILEAAIEFVEGRADAGGGSQSVASKQGPGRRMSDGERGELIAASGREYDGGAREVRVATRESFVNDALRQAGQPALKDAELLHLKG